MINAIKSAAEVEPEGVGVMATSERALIEKIKQLPPQRIAEVEDFVDFLRARDDEQGLKRAAAKAGEASLAAVWDNDDDAAYDRM